MTKYIQLAVGQTVSHVSKKYQEQGVGDVVSFSESGFRVKWRNSGQEIDYSPGTSMLTILPETVIPKLHRQSSPKLPTEPTTGREKSNALDSAQHTITTSEIVEMRNQISGRTLKEVQEVQGPGFGAMSFCSRVQGTSTAQALSMVSNAILHPYTWHKSIADHHGTVDATRSMFTLFQRLVLKLDLKGFEFRADLTYRCVPVVKEVRRTIVETITSSYR